MFNGCSSLISIDLFNFKINNNAILWVICLIDVLHLKSLDLSCLNTFNVMDMSYFLNNCTFNFIDLSKLNTNNVINMSGMFVNYINLCHI